MEPEYNLALNNGDLHACSSVIKNGEIGRTPLSEVSNLTSMGDNNKTTGVEVAVNNISRAMLKRIDPKAQVKGAGKKEGEVDPDTNPQSLGPPSVREEHVDGDPELDEIMQIKVANFHFPNFYLVLMNILIWNC